jgi:hypothetical protein
LGKCRGGVRAHFHFGMFEQELKVDQENPLPAPLVESSFATLFPKQL